MRERVVEVAGISTPVLEGGTGAPIILLHGIGSFAPEWSLVIDRLTPRHRVVAPDLPGLGASRAGGFRSDEATLMTWLAELIDQTCDDRPVLVGHSAGGGIAVRFASRSPDRVRHAILIDSSSLGRFRPAIGLVVAIARFGARPSPRSRARFLDQVLAQPDEARTVWGVRWEALEAYDLSQAADKEVSAANGRLMRQVGIRRVADDRLASNSVPVSLIWGKEDRLMPVRIARRASARYSWPLQELDRCGHGPQIERPSDLVDAIESALR